MIGEDAYRSDVLATAGLDDRKSSHGYLSRAAELITDSELPHVEKNACSAPTA